MRQVHFDLRVLGVLTWAGCQRRRRCSTFSVIRWYLCGRHAMIHLWTSNKQRGVALPKEFHPNLQCFEEKTSHEYQTRSPQSTMVSHCLIAEMGLMAWRMGGSERKFDHNKGIHIWICVDTNYLSLHFFSDWKIEMATFTKYGRKWNPLPKKIMLAIFLATLTNSYRGCTGEVRGLVTISAKFGEVGDKIVNRG